MFFGLFPSKSKSEELIVAPIEVAPDVRKRPKNLSLRAKPINAGRTDRLTSDMPSTPMSAMQYISRWQKIAVARARYISMNNGYGLKYKKMCRKNIIGANGIRLQAQVRNKKGSLDDASNMAIERAWKEWGIRQNCDITEQQSWKSFEDMLVDSLVDNGEYMFLIVEGKDTSPWEFSLKQLDPVFCPSDFSSTTGSIDGAYIWNGIEFNELGRRIGYYFINNSSTRDGIYTYGGRPYQRIAASNIIHGFEHIMVGQTRGFPWLTSGIFNISNLGEINTAALVSVRANATSAGFIKQQYGDDFDSEKEIEIEQGQYNLIPPDVDVTEPNIKTPDSNYPNFTKEQLREISGGGDVSYNDLSSNMEGVNYSSIRHATIGERDGWELRQNIVSEGFHEQVYRRWLPLQLLRGAIVGNNGIPLSAAKLDKFKPHIWQARRWQWVDPQKEMNADAKSIDYLTNSFSGVIRNRGRDPQTVFQEWANDLDTFRKLGIPEEKINFLLSGGKTTNDGIINEDSDTPAGSAGGSE